MEKLMRATKLKKNNGQIARKVDEATKYKKRLTYLKKIMGRCEKTSIKKQSSKNIFYLLK